MSILESIYKTTPKRNNNFKKNIIKLNFTNGAKVQLVGNKEEEITVVFIDNDTKSEIYRSTIKNNCWASPYTRYFVNWKILFIKGGEIVSDFNFSLKNKKVFIYNDSPALGDAIAWMPYVEEFRKKHQCLITYSTPYKELFEKEYLEINFDNNLNKKEDYYTCYKITISLNDDKFLHKNKWNKIPLQQIAADILGLEYKPIRPKITIENKTNNFKRKYVTIGTQSTSQCKYWNNKNGWKETVKYLKDIGYDSVCIDRYKVFGVEGSYNHIPSNAIDKTGDYDLQSRITDIYNSEFFIGLGSGLSWLAWALGKKVILISGFSHPISEFETPYRVINYNVCNSCWNNHKFDRRSWFWCPENKNFECSKEISVDQVVSMIKRILNPSNYTFYIQDNKKVNLADIPYKKFKRLIDIKDEYGWEAVLFNEIFNIEEYAKYGRGIKKGDTVLDIGANIGVFSRYATLKGAKYVHSYEPSQEYFKLLNLNKTKNNKVYNIAIGDKNESSVLYSDGGFGGFSLKNNNDFSNLSQEIQVKSLELIIKEINAINFLKIDIEGYEVEILNSLSDESINKIEAIAMEYHHNMYNYNETIRDNLVDKFKNRGFKHFLLYLGQNKNTQMLYFWRV